MILSGALYLNKDEKAIENRLHLEFEHYLQLFGKK